LQLIVNTLRGIKTRGPNKRRAYYVTGALLDSQHFGVAQARQRLYILGVLNSAVKGREALLGTLRQKLHQYPPELRHFLGPPCRLSEPGPSQKTAKKNLAEALRRIKKDRFDPNKVDVVVDLADGRGCHMTWDICPTITRTRAGSLDYWCTSLRRRLSVDELLRLQGIRAGFLDFAGIPLRQVGMMAGNAMTVPVLAHVLRVGVLAAGLAKEP
jgi:site-specific DNA-cytosine methylase